jgi:hypothetical protein
MAKEIIFLVEDAPEGGYVAQALGYSIFTEAPGPRWGKAFPTDTFVNAWIHTERRT